jgi:hypothetical protein
MLQYTLVQSDLAAEGYSAQLQSQLSNWMLQYTVVQSGLIAECYSTPLYSLT